MALSRIEGTLTWAGLKDGLYAACRVYCMIGLILAGASFLTLAMGFIGLPREVAAFIGGLHLSPFWLLMLLMVFFIILGCFLDGISGASCRIWRAPRCPSSACWCWPCC